MQSEQYGGSDTLRGPCGISCRHRVQWTVRAKGDGILCPRCPFAEIPEPVAVRITFPEIDLIEWA